MNDASFFGGGDGKDPVAGANSGDGTYSFPRRPTPKRMKGLSRFVVTRGCGTVARRQDHSVHHDHVAPLMARIPFL